MSRITNYDISETIVHQSKPQYACSNVYIAYKVGNSEQKRT